MHPAQVRAVGETQVREPQVREPQVQGLLGPLQSAQALLGLLVQALAQFERVQVPI